MTQAKKPRSHHPAKEPVASWEEKLLQNIRRRTTPQSDEVQKVVKQHRKDSEVTQHGEMIFQDRIQAGEMLAQRLATLALDPNQTLLFALPRGGIPLALPVARKLGLSLHVLVVRKIGAPDNPELAIGAVCEDGIPWINTELKHRLGLSTSEIQALSNEAFEEVRQRVSKFRAGRTLPVVRGKTALVVDDGFATGATAIAAARLLKRNGAHPVILAAPVAAPETISRLRQEAEQVVCLETPAYFSAVGTFYRDFRQVQDDEVVRLLETGSHPFPGELRIPENPKALIVFAHGSGSGRFSPRNRLVAQALHRAGFGTLLFDLLSEDEAQDRTLVFDIPFLAERLISATDWAVSELKKINLSHLPIGYFGASTGAGAALWAASEAASQPIYSIVSRGGRPDLAATRLHLVNTPTLLIVGEADPEVLQMNQSAQLRLKSAEIQIVPRATHLFEEPGALEEVCRMAIDWFSRVPAQAVQPVRRYG